MPRAKKKEEGCWSYSAGSYGYTVRVYERADGGNIQIEYRHPRTGPKVWRSLGHKNRDKAEDEAEEVAQHLKRKRETPYEARPPTVKRVFKLYRKHRTPDKSDEVQAADARKEEMWTRFLGPHFDLSRLSRREWDTFKRRRATGEIDARGNPVQDEKERCRRAPRTAKIDLDWLKAVIHWAMEFRDEAGYLLMKENPTLGLEMPEEGTPKRPVATTDRLETLRQHVHKARMRVEWNGRREYRESHLPEILDLAAETGRRISAICSLRYEDLVLERMRTEPYGAIVWPADTDKESTEWRCPLNPKAREAVERALLKRQAVGPGPLFPSCKSIRQPVRSDQAIRWLRKAEKEAGLEPQERGAFHPYRRMWASVRKTLPAVDVAKAGGWASTEAMEQSYVHPDAETMLRVVEHKAELREVR